MRKAVIIFFVSIICLNLHAQTTYNRMLTADTVTWQHFGIMFGVKSSQPQNVNLNNCSMAAIDTISIGGFLYKKLYELSIPAYINYSNKILRGFIREDSLSKKVFFKETTTTPEFVLYDFSLNVADSTFMTFPNNPSFNGFYRIDSIKTINELCGPRKHFFYRKHVNNFNQAVNYFEFVESIGSTYHFLYPFNSGFLPIFLTFQSGCYHKWELGLACKKNKQNQQYQSCTYNSTMWTNFINSCTYYYFTGGLRENTLLNQFSAYPNPAYAKVALNFYIEKNESLTINVVDLLGKIILSNKNISFTAGYNTFELNTLELESGVYYLVIENKEFKTTQPLIIQK